MTLDSKKILAGTRLAKFRHALRAWFLRERREMAWRSERSVYRTVVSEFMLQQTQVETVRPYFENWTQKWQSFEALAGAPESEILRAWEGLGYYSRARNLHALAKQIIASGNVPASVEGWLAFRGIGAYTAAAIVSIAQGVPAAVVDGNVVRILARLTATETFFKDGGAAVKTFAPLAGTLLDPDFPGDHNEAMMELGAMLCTKHKPQCARCPIAKFCAGSACRHVAELPRFIARATKKIELNRAFVCRNDAILLMRPPAKSKRLRELLEFPLWETIFTGTVNSGTLLLEGRRGIANESIRERIFAPAKSARLPRKLPENLRFVPLSELETHTLSGPHRKWLRKILETKDGEIFNFFTKMP